ncbi:MAG: hypothetical protein OEW42_20115, partial [Acidimicrobiia bacterium]|nr:hypothetical protein [Acidimicrobiia bacterium]
AVRVTRIRNLAWLVLPVWTLLVWVPRIRNIWTDDELSAGGQTVRTAWALVFIAFAVGAVVLAVRRSATEPGSPRQRWMQAFVVWTVAFWAMRGTQIALADHQTSFIVVHTVLASVSVGLAVWSWPRPAAGWLAHDPPLDHG